MEYELIRERELSYFNRLINEKLKDGWRITGNTVIKTEKDSFGTFFYQVVTKGMHREDVSRFVLEKV